MTLIPTPRRVRERPDEISLAAALDTLVSHRWLIALVTAACVGAGTLYAFLSHPLYQADILVQVEDSGDASAAKSLLGDVSSLFDVKSTAAAEAQILASLLVVTRAVDTLRSYIVVQPQRFPVVGDFISRFNTGITRPGVLGLEVPVDDRCHPEPAGEQDQDRHDDSAAEHRNALIATDGLKRAVTHEARRRRAERENRTGFRPEHPSRWPLSENRMQRSCQTDRRKSGACLAFSTCHIWLILIIELERSPRGKTGHRGCRTDTGHIAFGTSAGSTGWRARFNRYARRAFRTRDRDRHERRTFSGDV
ncbi:Wzz/FepE/Etk N-terminal domain-containing protein [Burkholderia sp. Bp8963]|uniref:Wzz/FepE/Etk N-terminal domain-containing protein n=1 Tax=Burkholderia sp. Bp8963 TaxID=2184547 RepID=UPI0039082968